MNNIQRLGSRWTEAPGWLYPPRGMTIKGLFFDLYGTLLIYGDMDRAWSDWFSALRENLDRYGFPVDSSVLTEACVGFFGRPEPALLHDGLTVYERRLEVLFDGLGITLTPDQLSEAATMSAESWQRYIHLDPEAIPLLNAARNCFPLALISNFDHPPHVYRLLQTTGLAPYFDVVVISGDVGIKKPDPRIFKSALERLDLLPKQVAFVGDSPEDVRGATAASLTPIMIRRDAHEESGPTVDFRVSPTGEDAPIPLNGYRVRSLGELRELELFREPF